MNEDHDIGIKLSRKSYVKLFFVCFGLSLLFIFGYLAYEQHSATDGQGYNVPDLTKETDAKSYTNNYWGFKINYPPNWGAVNGSIKDGEYYFSSSPQNFANELSDGDALIEVKTFNNWQKLSFEDWLTDQEKNSFPVGTLINKKPYSIGKYQGKRYVIRLLKPINNTFYWDIIAISRNDQQKYEFILMTDNQKTHDKYLGDFEGIKNSLEFYTGFGSQN